MHAERRGRWNCNSISECCNCWQLFLLLHNSSSIAIYWTNKSGTIVWVPSVKGCFYVKEILDCTQKYCEFHFHVHNHFEAFPPTWVYYWTTTSHSYNYNAYKGSKVDPTKGKQPTTFEILLMLWKLIHISY